MPVVALINRKGGSGKSMLATHLAVHFAKAGQRVMLGDLDRQQSAHSWLRRRATAPQARGGSITAGATELRHLGRTPAGISHVVLDTPGGLDGLELARVVMQTDAILVPVGASVFDRESAAACLAELMSLPRVASGRCKVAVVGMRIDARTRGGEQLKEWAGVLGVPLVGVLRETHGYVRCIESGLSLFDLTAAQAEADRLQWQPVLDWLGDALAASARDTSPATTPATAPAALAPRSAAAPRTAGMPRASAMTSAALPATAPPRPAVVQRGVPARAAQVPAGVLEAAPRRGFAARLVAWLSLQPLRRA
jgi:chromosome partitioning protein